MVESVKDLFGKVPDDDKKIRSLVEKANLVAGAFPSLSRQQVLVLSLISMNPRTATSIANLLDISADEVEFELNFLLTDCGFNIETFCIKGESFYNFEGGGVT